MTAVSEITVINRALTKLGARRITSRGDGTTEANAMDAIYDVTRDAELRAHPWNFATKRVQLSALTAAPTWGYALQYQLPSDCLRPLQVGNAVFNSALVGVYFRESLTGDADDAPFQIESGKIHTDMTAPLNFRYTRREDNAALFDPLFVDALACRLVIEADTDITNASASDIQRAQAQYDKAIFTAKRVNAIEKPPRNRTPGRFSQARF